VLIHVTIVGGRELHRRPAGGAGRRRGLCAALLRGEGPDPVPAHVRQPAPLQRDTCAGSRSSDRAAGRHPAGHHRRGLAVTPRGTHPTAADWAALSEGWRAELTTPS
jgi:hypothetical protein